MAFNSITVPKKVWTQVTTATTTELQIKFDKSKVVYYFEGDNPEATVPNPDYKDGVGMLNDGSGAGIGFQDAHHDDTLGNLWLYASTDLQVILKKEV